MWVTIKLYEASYADLLGLEEIFGIVQEHLFHAGIEYNTAHWPLVTRICPAPRSMRVCKVYLNPMNSLGFVFLLSLKDQLFQDCVGPGDNADHTEAFSCGKSRSKKNDSGVPDRQYFGTASVRLPSSPYTEPMTPVINGMGGIKSRLEDHTCGDFPRQVIIPCVSRGEPGVVRIIEVFLAEGVGGVGTDTGGACCGLEFTRALPFRAAGEPEHEPVVRVVFLGEVGREEERYMG